MKTLAAYILTRLAILIAIICFTLLVFGGTGCGPLSPHVTTDNQVHVDGNVTGEVTIKLDPAQLEAMFTAECKQFLPGAADSEIQTCVTNLVNDFNKLIK